MNKTKNIIIVWYEESFGSLEEKIPLLWAAKRNKKLGSHNPLTLIFLSGMTQLAPAYLQELKRVGYQLVDAETRYRDLAKRFQSLDRFGQYEKYCFLRWLVIAKLYPNQPLIHYDGDIVWEITPEVVSKLVRSKTFVLDGCPAFTVISDSRWFTLYEQELNKFVINPEKYGRDWVGTEFRKNIGSDQDLIGYLLQKQLLPQEKPPKSKYQFVENPLTLRSRSSKNLAFWHMQTDFVHYINLHYMLSPYGLSRYTPNPLTIPLFLIKIIYLLGKIAGKKYLSRRQAYHYWFETAQI